MFCENCGSSVSQDSLICPNCGASVSNAQAFNAQAFNVQPVQMKTTKLLVFSIIEAICINPIFGFIAVILYFASLQPAINSGNLTLAQQRKKTIQIILLIGLSLFLVSLFLIAPIMLVAIPNYSGINATMQVHSDKIEDQNIGRLARIWYTEAQQDVMIDEITNDEDIEEGFVRVDQMDGFELHIAPYTKPKSYRNDDGSIEDSAFYVRIINPGDISSEKIVVAIGPENLTRNADEKTNEIFYQELELPIYTTYDGNGSGIAYIEP